MALALASVRETLIDQFVPYIIRLTWKKIHEIQPITALKTLTRFRIISSGHHKLGVWFVIFERETTVFLSRFF